jgi:hypothetical protein
MVQVIKVFRPASADGSVDKTKPYGFKNMIPCDHDSPALIDKQQVILEDTVRDPVN